MKNVKSLLFASAAVTAIGIFGAQAQNPDEPTITTAESDALGTYLVVDGKAVYLFEADEQGSTASACEGDCIAIWPAVIVAEGLMPQAGGDEVDAALIGTIEREDGVLQLTYNGWPLYF